ncbi:MAG: nucleoside kinase [Clostridia bacterium]|nr:nucleoside kinase [Clostridia bacterium]
MESIEKYTAEIINKLSENAESFVIECSENYISSVKRTAETVYENVSTKIVMLAGPSSSGKTTTAALLSKEVERLGGKAYTVSLDDFYLNRSEGYPLDENGEPDFECVEALDVELIHSCLRELIDSGESLLPVFDFTTGIRHDASKRIKLNNKDVLIVEGLHALNPVITDTLDKESLYKIYVSVSSRVYDEHGESFLSKRNLRFLRRMLRDYLFRAMPVEGTFDIWKSVTRGENKYLFPFEENADIKLNSFHPCEPCIIGARALPLLKEIKNEAYADKAQELIRKLELFNKIDCSILPQDCLLREFTG